MCVSQLERDCSFFVFTQLILHYPNSLIGLIASCLTKTIRHLFIGMKFPTIIPTIRGSSSYEMKIS